MCGSKLAMFWSRPHKYCSLRCAWDDPDRVSKMKPKDRGVAICESCRKVFKLHRQSGKGRFCCQACARSFIGAITIHRNRLFR